MLKLKQLQPIVEEYLRAFPGWKMVGRDCFARESGPIFQGILLERLSFDDRYRPVYFIGVLLVPSPDGTRELTHSLLRPNGTSGWSVPLDRHYEQRDDILRAIREQAVPSVNESLDPLGVLSLYEREALPTTLEACSIAALHAYFGHLKEAREWSDRVPAILANWPKPGPPECMLVLLRFAADLQRWLTDGTYKQELDKIIQQQREIEGLAAPAGRGRNR